MQLTPEEKQIGKDNFHEASADVQLLKKEKAKKSGDSAGITRRDAIKAAAISGVGLGAAVYGYEELAGSDRVKVGFIGTGDEGSVLLTQHPPKYMDIVAIADIRPSNRKRAFTGDGNDHRVGLYKKLGREKCESIKVYNDHKELLADPDVEAVVIAVPLNQHEPIAIEALEAGKHVLSEKLMAHNITECKNLIRKANEKGLLYAVGHQRHYNVLYENAYELIKEGILGDIKFIRAQWHRNNSFPNSDSWHKPIPKEDAEELQGKVTQYGYESVEELCRWRLYNRTGGGLMAELGSHQLDACSIFLGKVRPIAVQGYGGRNFYGVKGVGSKDKQQDNREIDDHVYVTFEFPGPHYDEDQNDVVIVTYSSINTNRMEPYGETVFGSRGTMIVELEQDVMLFKEAGGATGGGGPAQRLQVLNKGGGPVMDASASLAPTTKAAQADIGEVSRGYTEEMEHFAYCVRNNINKPREEGGLRCNGVVAMQDAIMALTANLAMKHKKRIVFKDEWFDPESDAVPETDPDIIG